MSSLVSAAVISLVCSFANENYPLALQCPQGQAVSKISFASYGTPTASDKSICSSYSISTNCHSTTSVSAVSDACVGKSSCTVSASNSVFGDPCYGTLKRLFVSAECTSGASNTPVNASPSPVSAAALASSWKDYANTLAAGGDLNANCRDGGGMYDSPGNSLVECKALCAADAACGAVTWIRQGGFCIKKCRTSVASKDTSYVITHIPSNGDVIAYLAHTTRLTQAQIDSLPTPPTPSSTPSAAPSQLPDGLVLPANAIVHFTPRPAANTASSYVIPSGIKQIEVALWGAGGGTLQDPAYGGAGAFVTGYLPVTPGEELRIIAGRYGKGRGNGNGGELDGAAGQGFNTQYCASSGGGFSSIQRKNAAGVWENVVVAGGGGGGCYSYDSNAQPHGGAGSWNGTAQRGFDREESIYSGGEAGISSLVGSGGGSLAFGGRSLITHANLACANNTYGRKFKGGDVCVPTSGHYGSGGGGGYYGGGGDSRCQGSGGGSSLITNLVSPRGETPSKSAHYLAGGRSHPAYLSGYGDRDSSGHVALTVPPPCDPSGACYRGFSVSANWTNARRTCRGLGAGWDLVTIFDDASYKAVTYDGQCKGTLVSDDFWTGFNDPSSTNRGNVDVLKVWKWSSGASDAYYQKNYQKFWLSGEPNNYAGMGGEYCAQLRFGDALNDQPCRSEMPFCCQWLPPSMAILPSASNSVTPSTSPSASTSVSTTASRSASPSSSASVSASVTSSRSTTPSPSNSLTPSNSASGSVSPSVSVSPSASVSASASASGSVSPSASISTSATPSPSSSPLVAREQRCKLGTSLIPIDKAGTLLVSTPAEALNGTMVSTLSCSWVITAPVGYRVSLSFLAVAMQPNLDFLSAFDGPSASSPVLLYMQDGSGGWAPRPITSSGNSLYIWFNSVNYRSSKGIVASPAFIPVATSSNNNNGNAGSNSNNGNALLQPLPNELGAMPPATALKSGAAPAESINDNGYQSVFRCGPATTSGNINGTGTILVTSPGLPIAPNGGSRPASANIDCSISITAPPGFVVALSYLNFTLAANLDFLSVHDGSNAAALPLSYMVTGVTQSQSTLAAPASDAEKNAEYLPPVVMSSGPYLYVRFQSVSWDLYDAATGRPRGVTALVNFMQAPAKGRLPSATTTSASGSSPNPLGCVSVNLRQKPWLNSPNSPNYQIGRDGGYSALAPATIDVTSLRGQTITLGYEKEGSTATLKDYGQYTTVLESCRANCSKKDTAPTTPSSADYTFPDYFRKRGQCGLSGLCLFLWSFTDSQGKLLAAPDALMTSPIVVPAAAVYMSFGYSDIDQRDNGGGASICLYPSQADPSPSTSPSPTPTSSVSASPAPPDVLIFVRVTIVITGPDAVACLSSKSCLNAATQAIKETAELATVSLQLLAAGVGDAPKPSNSNGNSNSKKRALLNNMASPSKAIIAGPLAEMTSSSRRLIQTANGDDAPILSDDLTAALLQAVSKDPLAPLWFTLQIGVKDQPQPASSTTGTTSGGRLLAATGAEAAADAYIANVNGALASGAFQQAFAANLEAALKADFVGEGADSSIQAYLMALKNPGQASSSVFSVAKVANAAAAATPTPAASGGGSGGGGLSAAAVAGIAVVAVALVGLGVGFFVYRLRSAKRTGQSNLAVKSVRVVSALATSVAGGVRSLSRRPNEPSLVQSQAGRYDNTRINANAVDEESMQAAVVPGQVVASRQNPIHQQRASITAGQGANSLVSARAVYTPSALGGARKSAYGAPPIKMQELPASGRNLQASV